MTEWKQDPNPNLEEWKGKLLGKTIVALRRKLQDPKTEYWEFDIGKQVKNYKVVSRGEEVKDSVKGRLQIHIDQYRKCTDVTIG